MFSTRQHRKSRRAIAVTEAAFCIPAILILAFGTLEYCKLIFIKERVAISAFEGARKGVKRRATAAQSEAVCRDLLDSFGIENYKIVVSPNDFSNLNALDPVTVHVEVPLTGVALFFGNVINLTSLSATVKMAREFDD